jgi:mRNA-degrading endonuclease RelE of RelBE toxin-antitoxin system
MTRQSKFAIVYSPDVMDHLEAIERKHHRSIEKGIDEQLSHTPNRRTRNRKPLEELPGPLGSTWELRCGPDNQFRVFYEVIEDDRVVWVLALGIKEGNRLLIAGEEHA